MPRFLFWNYKYDSPDRESLLATLVREHLVDVVILAEASVDDSALLPLLGRGGRPYHPMPIPHDWIKIYAGYPSAFFLDWQSDEGRLCLRKIQFPGHDEIILGSLHLPSGLHAERSERLDTAQPVARKIREVQREFEHARVIVVGDFNLNPHDDGMVFPSSFGAMTSKELVKKYAIHEGDRYARLYNPMWSLLGGEVIEGPPGTFYWPSHRAFNIYWNYPDQVLVGYDLLDQFPDHQLRILAELPDASGREPLFRETYRHWAIDRVSDHLPLLFDLDLGDAAQ